MPSTLSSTICCHSGRGASTTGPSSTTPSLWMSVSRRPSPSTVRSTAPTACCSSVTSHSSTSAVPPWSLMSAASASSRSPRRAASATAAPSAASAVAAAAPMPLEAPVTSATVPSSTDCTRKSSPLTHRGLLGICHLVMLHRQVTFYEELLVVRVIDRLLDVLAGEAFDRGPGLPEAQRDEFGAVTLDLPEQPRPAVARDAAVALDSGP